MIKHVIFVGNFVNLKLSDMLAVIPDGIDPVIKWDRDYGCYCLEYQTEEPEKDFINTVKKYEENYEENLNKWQQWYNKNKKQIELEIVKRQQDKEKREQKKKEIVRLQQELKRLQNS